MSKFKTVFLISFAVMSFIELSAQEITMFQGFFGYQYYEDDLEISKKQVNTLMQQHEVTKIYWDKASNHKRYATIALGTQLLTGYLAIRSINNRTFGESTTMTTLLLVTSLTSGFVSFGFSLSSASLKKKSILGYNKLQSEEGLLLNIGQTDNGLGLVYSF